MTMKKLLQLMKCLMKKGPSTPPLISKSQNKEHLCPNPSYFKERSVFSSSQKINRLGKYPY